ncbi:MAG: carboxypeptidase regulatory-like domain-containing protein [Bacteroidota bacterium]
MYQIIRKKIGWAALLLMAMFAAAASVQAQPNAPNELRVIAQQGVVMAQWMPDSAGEDADGYRLWIAEGETNDPNDFAELADSLYEMRGMDPRVQMAFIDGLDSGRYSLYVTAYNSNGDSPMSNVEYFDVRPYSRPGFIQFTSYPEDMTATIGDTWTYDADAEYSESGDVKFSIEMGPQGMTIDENTGEVSWTPAQSGMAEVSLIAYVEGTNAQARQYFNLRALSCTNPAEITVNISLSNGEEPMFAMVEVYQQGSNPDSLMLYTMEGARGDEVELKLDAGTYYLHISGDRMYGEWYDDADDISNATPITVDCGDAMTINAELEARQNNYEVVRILSEPNDIAYVNQEYTYDVEATASDSNATILFELNDAPSGMTIDQNTGEISWTPTESGYYRVSVRAYIENSQAMDYQMYGINVRTCSTRTVITGTVSDQNGNPVEFAQAILLNDDDTLNMGHRDAYAMVDIIDGEFTIEADEGDFYLMFVGKDFYPEFWEDAEDMDNATLISLTCGDSIHVDATVESQAAYTYYDISGRVTDATDNSPIAGAFVQLIANNDNGRRAMFMGMTGQDGSYSITVPENFDYVARAFVFDSLNGTNGDYIPLYYDQTTDASAADVIDVTGDVTGIDFALSPRPDYTNEISGTLVNEDDMALENAYVIAVLVETGPWGEEYLFMGRTAETDDNGEFTMTNLIPGDYVLVGIPQSRNVMPGYYVENDLAARSWVDASEVIVSENSITNNVYFKLRNFSGFGRDGLVGIIRGFISRRGGSIKMDDRPQSYEAIAGALVYVIDEDGNVVGEQTTSTNGEFEIKNLAKGTYTLEADKIGYEPYVNIVELESDDDVANTDIRLSQMVTGVEDDPLGGNGMIAYPNPVKDRLNLRFNAATGRSYITIKNALGQSVYTSAETTVSGMNTLTINVSSVPAGSYYIEVRSGTNSFVAPVIIER